MQKKWLAVALASVLTVGGLGVANAADTKIGVVNTEVVLNDSPAAQAAGKKLEKEFEKRIKELELAGQRLKADIERFEKNAGTMTEQERIRKQRDIQERERDYQRRKREFNEDSNIRRNEEFKKLVALMQNVIQEIATKEGYDIILYGTQDLWYVSPKVNITDQVKKALK